MPFFVFGLLFVNNLLLFVVLCTCLLLFVDMLCVECPKWIRQSIVPTIFANSSTSWINDGLVYFKGMVSPSIYGLVHLMGNQFIFFVVLSLINSSISWARLLTLIYFANFMILSTFFDKLAILCNFVNFIDVYLMNSLTLLSCPCFGLDELNIFTISPIWRDC